MSDDEEDDESLKAESQRTDDTAPDDAKHIVFKAVVIFIITVGQKKADVVVDRTYVLFDEFADDGAIDEHVADEHSPEKSRGAEKAQSQNSQCQFSYRKH